MKAPEVLAKDSQKGDIKEHRFAMGKKQIARYWRKSETGSG